jgi:hypothetical protein
MEPFIYVQIELMEILISSIQKDYLNILSPSFIKNGGLSSEYYQDFEL